MWETEIPHPEISPGIIAKFVVFSAGSRIIYYHSSSCLSGFCTGEETSGLRKSLREGVST